MEIKLNVYDDDGQVVKTCKAQPVKFKFGTIRSLMKLLNIDDINDTSDLLGTIYGAWDQLTKVLSQCFPDMEEEDWDNVNLDELVPAVLTILKFSFANILSIPQDKNSKNLIAE